jgi:ABC-type lipoprotein release transport system permease subunit
MIKFSDATLLALTKLRAHKVRTIVTTLLASLLFGVLIAGSLVVNGVFNSIDNFSTDGLTSRYIVNVNNAIVQTTSTSVLRDKELINKAKVQYADLIEEKQNEAKKLVYSSG